MTPYVCEMYIADSFKIAWHCIFSVQNDFKAFCHGFLWNCCALEKGYEVFVVLP